MTAVRRDAEVWQQQRDALRRLPVEDRVRQNDAMTRLRLAALAARQRSRA
jgi:hypothetical protein